MEIEKKELEGLWVPKEIADLWTGELAESGGSYEYCLLDNLRAYIQALKDDVLFAEENQSYEDYAAEMMKPSHHLTSYYVEDLVKHARECNRLEDGQQLLRKGIDSKKLLKAHYNTLH